MEFKDGLSIIYDDETERLLIMDDFDGFIIGYFEPDIHWCSFDRWVKCYEPFLISPSRISPVSEKLFNEITNGSYPSVHAFHSTREVLENGFIPERDNTGLAEHRIWDDDSHVTFVATRHSNKRFGYFNNDNGLYYFDFNDAYLLAEDFDLSDMDKYKSFGACGNGKFIKVSTITSYENDPKERIGCFGKWGWIDSHGKKVVPCKYSYVSDFANEMIVANYVGLQVDDEDMSFDMYDRMDFGVVDVYGNELVPCEFYDVAKIKCSWKNMNCYLVWMHDSRNGKYLREHICIYDVNSKTLFGDADIGHDWNFSGSYEIMDNNYIYIYEYDYLATHHDGYISIYSFANKRWECENAMFYDNNGMFVLKDGRTFPRIY